LNRGKSNIGWQEATLSGAASLTPEWWGLEKESFIYSGERSFKYSFESLISDENNRSELHKAAFEALKEDYLLSKVNQERLTLLKSIL
jgi:hypothetical protein